MNEDELSPPPGTAPRVVRASVRPLQTLDLLSRREMASLANADASSHELFRRCALAILNTDGGTDDARAVYDAYRDFAIEVVPEPRGLQLVLSNAPAQAFVDGRMIAGIRSHLFAALRDIIFTEHKLAEQQAFDLTTPDGITDAVFRILRNANVVRSNLQPRLVVCWGGHSIPRGEYDYSKNVGYSLGLRGFDICTGCGAGAMKGPMKGAAIAHAKQLNRDGRFLGVSEPGIIAAESPNAIVNELVILPDIEKRLEAFVRIAHGLVVFPGGVGTAEEFLYLLGILLHPDNRDVPFPVILTGPSDAADYLQQLHDFVGATLGEEAQKRYQIIFNDPAEVARQMTEGLREVRRFRRERNDAFHFNWLLKIEEGFQRPFDPTHEAMASLPLRRDLPPHELAANLRRAFSGIVAGNVKDKGIRRIEQYGRYEIHGDTAIMQPLDKLLQAFVQQHRMKLPGGVPYTPCYRVVT